MKKGGAGGKFTWGNMMTDQVRPVLQKNNLKAL